MGKKRDPVGYFKELSEARKRITKANTGAMLRRTTGLREKPNIAMMRYRFQDKPRKEQSKTIRKILKQAHPEQKFSVTTKQGTIRVGWRDGPSVPQIKKLGFWRYNTPHSDGRGGVTSYQYLFLNRELSPELKKTETKRILSQWDTKDMRDYRKDEIVYREMYKTDYPSPGKPGRAPRPGKPRKV